MGKRSTKCHPQKKFDSVEKNLLLYLTETFPDESNDSGLGSDGSIIVPDSNGSRYLYDSSDSLSDSIDSSPLSCSPPNVVNYPPPPRVLSSHSVLNRIDSNLDHSLKNKIMHIQTVDVEMKPFVNDVGSLIEPPLAKRRKMVADNANCEMLQESRENVHGCVRQVVHRYSTETTSVSGVLTDASVCHNSIGKRISATGDSSVVGDDFKDRNSRDTYALHSNSTHTVRGGERIAALLSASSQSLARKRPLKKPSLHVCFPPRSKDCKVELSIVIQPEEQHRARYMTEGSRGSIKDEKGTGFPTIKLSGYSKPVTLQVFIGSDTGKIQPHLFYQACKVTGKNCTPCTERMIEGTSVIEINMLPESEMIVSCDCIGILKERNVDVEQRLPYFGLARCKKRSTKCRMVFRVNIPLSNGNFETIQIASSQILCTQSPGLPEICKKSLTECSMKGGTELFIIGKNFQKDAKVIFQELTDDLNDDGMCGKKLVWEEVVDPEKEFLHQSHMICCVPPYRDGRIVFPVKVYLSVLSGGKSSEPHTFTYTPCQAAPNGKYDGCNSSYSVGNTSPPLEYARNGLLSPSSIHLPRTHMVPSAVLSSAAASNSDGMMSPIGIVCSTRSSPESPTTRNPSLALQLMSPHSHMRNSSTPSPISHPSANVFASASECVNLLSDATSRQMTMDGVVNLSVSNVSEMTHSSPTPISSPPSVIISPEHIITPAMCLTPNVSPRNTVQSHITSLDVNSGHDIDLMCKIDQLATEMTNEEAKCSRSLTICDPAGSGDVTSRQMPMPQVASVVPNVHSLLSMTNVPSSSEMVRVSEKVDNIGGVSVPTPLNIAPPTVESVVSAMITLTSDTLSSQSLFSVPNNSASYLMSPNALSQSALNMNMQLMDVQRNDMEAKTQGPINSENSTLPFNGNNNGGIVVVDDMRRVPQPLVSSSADILTESSMSYNVHCCSAMGQRPRTVISSSSSVGNDHLNENTNEMQMFSAVSSSATQVGITSSAVVTVSDKPQTTSTVPLTSSSETLTTSSTTNANKPDMNSMTLAFSQLSDADLLSIINPSAFDSV